MMIWFKVQYIINTISPVFVVIILGAILRLSGFFKDEITQALSKLTYWVALPVLLFYSIATSQYGFSQALPVFYAIAAGMVVAIAASAAICILFKIDRSSAGAFIQGAFRGNLIFIGLPLVVYSFAGRSQGGIDKLQEMAILSLSLAIPLYNIVAIVLLLVCKHSIDIKTPFKIIKELLTNPLVIASGCGILYLHYFSSMPIVIERSCQIIGRMALPLALLSIGASIVCTKNASDYPLALTASLIKVALCPFAGFFIARYLGLSADQTKIALLFLACPTAVSSYIMASQMGSNARLAAAIVVVSSVMSVAAIIAVLILI